MSDIYQNPHNNPTKNKHPENWDFNSSKKEIEKFHNSIVKPIVNTVKEIKNSIN